MPLQLSLWVVFIGLLLLISILEPLILDTFFNDPKQRISATYISLIITRFLIFPWQLIGLLRASDKYFITHGSTNKTRFIQALMFLSVIFTMVYSVELIQTAKFNIVQIQNSSQDIKPPGYTLEIKRNDQQLIVSGEIEIGITQALELILKENPDLSTVILESIGGQIYEGRGLSRLFTKHQIDTYSYQECSSACATAFIGGKTRHLGQSAKLGFHQYKQDTTKFPKAVPFHNLIEEQNHDLKIFKSQSIHQQFLDKVFLQTSDGIWYPTHSELLEAGVIHSVIIN